MTYCLVTHLTDRLASHGVLGLRLNSCSEFFLKWGAGQMLTCCSYIDPTLVHDLQSPTKPWALSPLVSTMPHFMHTRVPVADTPSDDCSEFLAAPPATTTRHKNGMAKLPPFPPAASITDDTSQLHLAMMDSHSSSGSTSDEASSSKSSISSTLAATAAHSYTDTANTSPKVRAKRGMSRLRDASKNALKPRRSKSASPHPGLGLETASQRQAYFSSSEHRQAIRFGPEVRGFTRLLCDEAVLIVFYGFSRM